jgi:hypothetical protein
VTPWRRALCEWAAVVRRASLPLPGWLACLAAWVAVIACRGVGLLSAYRPVAWAVLIRVGVCLSCGAFQGRGRGEGWRIAQGGKLGPLVSPLCLGSRPFRPRFVALSGGLTAGAGVR